MSEQNVNTPERLEYAEYVESQGRESAQNVLRFLGNNVAGWIVSIRTVLGEPDMWFTKQGETSICAPNGSKVYKQEDGFKVITAQGREYIGLPSLQPAPASHSAVEVVAKINKLVFDGPTNDADFTGEMERIVQAAFDAQKGTPSADARKVADAIWHDSSIKFVEDGKSYEPTVARLAEHIQAALSSREAPASSDAVEVATEIWRQALNVDEDDDGNIQSVYFDKDKTAALIQAYGDARVAAAVAPYREALETAAKKFAQVQRHDASKFMGNPKFSKAFEHNCEHPTLGISKANGSCWLTPGEVARDGEREALEALATPAATVQERVGEEG